MVNHCEVSVACFSNLKKEKPVSRPDQSTMWCVILCITCDKLYRWLNFDFSFLHSLFRGSDVTYRLSKCIKIALLYLEVSVDLSCPIFSRKVPHFTTTLPYLQFSDSMRHELAILHSGTIPSAGRTQCLFFTKTSKGCVLWTMDIHTHHLMSCNLVNTISKTIRVADNNRSSQRIKLCKNQLQLGRRKPIPRPTLPPFSFTPSQTHSYT